MRPSSPAPRVDVAVIGAGPAGLAAATLAAELGLSVEVLDERPAAGGHRFSPRDAQGSRNAQDSRHPHDAPRAGSDGDDNGRWDAVMSAFERSGATHRARARVWAIDTARSGAASGMIATELAQSSDGSPIAAGGFRVAVSVAGTSSVLIARKLLIATGAQERPFAIPGGTLPGVIDASALHDMLSNEAPPSEPIALAGCGPLLYESAARLLRAGAEVVAILDTLERANLLRALPFAGGFMRSSHFKSGGKLLRYVNERVKIMRGVTLLEAVGGDNLAAVRFASPAATGQVPVSTLVLHQGLIPSIQMAGALGCAHEWDERERCWQPRTDGWGATNVADVHVVGDAAGVHGSVAALSSGRLCALGLASDLGVITPQQRDAQASTHRRALRDAMRGRSFLSSLFTPPKAFRLPSPGTVVCRCEGVTAGEVRTCVREGCIGPNQLKAFSRCGMGACQGRMCGLCVTEIIADERGAHPAEVGHFRLRFPVSPISLGELASMPRSSADEAAVHSSHTRDRPGGSGDSSLEREEKPARG